MPAKTIGFTSLYPGKGPLAGRRRDVSVSPTRSRETSLSPVTTYPTSPAPSEATGSRTGDMTPSSSASNEVPWTIARSGSRVSKRPSTTRTNATTPRYWS